MLVDEALLVHIAGFRAHHRLLRRLAGDCARMEASRSANRCSESSFRKQKHEKSRTGTMHCSALRANALLRAYTPGDARFLPLQTVCASALLRCTSSLPKTQLTNYLII